MIMMTVPIDVNMKMSVPLWYEEKPHGENRCIVGKS